MTTTYLSMAWVSSKIQPCPALMRCSKCETYKLPHEFSVSNAPPKSRIDINGTGRASQCKLCRNNFYQKRDQEDSRRRMLYHARHRALRAGIECTITVEDIKIPDFCPALGIPLCSSIGSGLGVTPKILANSPSLDRVDNTKGYTPGNVMVISLRANALKKDATVEELEGLLAYVKSHSLKA